MLRDERIVMTPHRIRPMLEVETIMRGAISPGARSEAMRMVGALVRFAHEPILHARVRLTRTGDPTHLRRVIAQVSLDVNGHALIAHAVGRSTRDALNLVRERMRHQFDRGARRWQVRRGGLRH